MLGQNIKSEYFFTRNPVLLDVDFLEGKYNQWGGRFTINFAQNEDFFEGRFYPPARIDVAEIIDSKIWPLGDPPADNCQPVFTIEDIGTLANRHCTVAFYYGEVYKLFEGYAFPGGVSRRTLRRLAAQETDVFASRLLASGCNFFMTTRTTGQLLSFKETELFPLYFIAENGGQNITAVDVNTGKGMDLSFDAGVNILDLENLRVAFAETHDVFSNAFDIYRNGSFSCRIVIRGAELSRARYRLKFRNSFGVFEVVELTGELKFTPEYSDGKDTVFNRYDPIVGGFVSDRERAERKLTANIDSGFKRPEEILFLMDMAASDEVYLLDIVPEPVKVIPSIKDLSYQARQEVPESLEIVLEIADTDLNIMDDLSAPQTDSARLFSSLFNNKFN